MFTTGTRVRFRDDFSPALGGLAFEVSWTSYAADGRELIGLARRHSGRWTYRTAWSSDLLPA